MDQSKIGSFLKELRKENGLTQENLAEQLNVSSKSISRWETGRNCSLNLYPASKDTFSGHLRTQCQANS